MKSVIVIRDPKFRALVFQLTQQLRKWRICFWFGVGWMIALSVALGVTVSAGDQLLLVLLAVNLVGSVFLTLINQSRCRRLRRLILEIEQADREMHP